MITNLSELELKLVNKYEEPLLANNFQEFYTQASYYSPEAASEIARFLYLNKDEAGVDVFKFKAIPNGYMLEAQELSDSVVLPDGVESIGTRAFAKSNLEDISIPDSVTIIGNEAFMDCTKLKHVKLSNNLTQLGRGTFKNCTNLSEIDIPESVTSIGLGCFEGCDKIKINIADDQQVECPRQDIAFLHKHVNRIKSTSISSESNTNDEEEIIEQDTNLKESLIEAFLLERFGAGCPEWLKSEFERRIQADPNFPEKLQLETGIDINYSKFHQFANGNLPKMSDPTMERRIYGKIDDIKTPIIPIFKLKDGSVYIRSYTPDDNRHMNDRHGNSKLMKYLGKGDLLSYTTNFCWVNVNQDDIDSGKSTIRDVKAQRAANKANDLADDRYRRYTDVEQMFNPQVKFDKSGYIIPGLDRFMQFVTKTTYTDPTQYLNDIQDKIIGCCKLHQDLTSKANLDDYMASLAGENTDGLAELKQAILIMRQRYVTYLTALKNAKLTYMDSDNFLTKIREDTIDERNSLDKAVADAVSIAKKLEPISIR